MKKMYRKPIASKVNFQFERTVVASALPIGERYKPTHPTECQMSLNDKCQYNYTAEFFCIWPSPFRL